MIHPSYSELIEAINTNNEDDDDSMVLNSRYSLVLATSKRARQIIAGSKPLTEGPRNRKPLSIAIDELYKGKVKILSGSHSEETEESAAAGELSEEELHIQADGASAEGAESILAAEEAAPDTAEDSQEEMSDTADMDGEAEDEAVSEEKEDTLE